MDPRHLFMDERLIDAACVYCGGRSETRDHVPSKALLDGPYPEELPVVGACRSCNSSFSLDEQYLACLIECVVCGTVQGNRLQRNKVRCILVENPKLRSRIESSRSEGDRGLVWQPELDRVRNVVLKLACGHAAYELYPQRAGPAEVNFAPLLILGESERCAFEGVTNAGLAGWPEIGTRAFSRAIRGGPDRFERDGEWIVVQPGRYRYAVLENDRVSVKMILSEYLACEVVWHT